RNAPGSTVQLTIRTEPSQHTTCTPPVCMPPKYRPQVPTLPSGWGVVVVPGPLPWAKAIVSLSQPSVHPWSSLQSGCTRAIFVSRYFSLPSRVVDDPLVMSVMRTILPDPDQDGTSGPSRLLEPVLKPDQLPQVPPLPT